MCKNKRIGIVSDKIFKDYPNVKMYIHGHGHSVQNSKNIDNVLCVTNPIVNNIYWESSTTYSWDEITGLRNDGEKLLSS